MTQHTQRTTVKHCDGTAQYECTTVKRTAMAQYTAMAQHTHGMAAKHIATAQHTQHTTVKHTAMG
jgi:hypothetical protein